MHWVLTFPQDESLTANCGAGWRGGPRQVASIHTDEPQDNALCANDGELGVAKAEDVRACAFHWIEDDYRCGEPVLPTIPTRKPF